MNVPQKLLTYARTLRDLLPNSEILWVSEDSAVVLDGQLNPIVLPGPRYGGWEQECVTIILETITAPTI